MFRPRFLSARVVKAAAVLATFLSVPGIALAVELTGGLPNQLVHIYYLPVVAGALFLPRRWSVMLTVFAVLLTSPSIDYLHEWLDRPLFYKNASPFNLSGSGWIVRPFAFFAINILASRVGASVAKLREANHALRAEVVERQRAEQSLESALHAELQLEGRLERQALLDPLTGLGNRSMFIARLDHALILAQARGALMGLIFLDTDDFKSVNDRWGHSAGDEVLVELGRRISMCCATGETAARLGGDEFAVIIHEPESTEAIRAFAERVVEALQAPISFSHGELFLRSSLGIAVASRDNRTSGVELLRQADIAMYMAKSSGKGCIEVFESSAAVGLVERIALAQDMQRAVARDEFVLHYQPCVSLATGETLGFEALVRWNHPRLGLLSPDRFIGLAEENGFIRELGAWVLREATRQCALWNNRRVDPLFIAINVSARQLSAPSLLEEVKAALADSGIAPDLVVLEITESAVMADAQESLLRLAELKEVGVKIAVDDFGTGYSSLNYLRRFPVDVLKIDKVFIEEIDEALADGGKPVLVHTIIEIGRTLGLQVVAEGIERSEQLMALRALGCEQGQGYYFGTPLPASLVEEHLREDDTAAA